MELIRDLTVFFFNIVRRDYSFHELIRYRENSIVLKYEDKVRNSETSSIDDIKYFIKYRVPIFIECNCNATTIGSLDPKYKFANLGC